MKGGRLGQRMGSSRINARDEGYSGLRVPSGSYFAAIPLHCASMKPASIKEFFQRLPGQLDTDAAEGLSAIYQFDLSGDQGGQYHLVIANGICSVREGVHPDPHVTFSMSGEDCLGVLSGRLDGAAVFLSGQLRLSGDLGLALQLTSLFPSIRPPSSADR